MASVDDLRLDRDGAERLPRVVDAVLGALTDWADRLGAGRAGVRLSADPWLRSLLEAGGVIGALAAKRTGPGCRPVRAILFDKSAAHNWALGWHQDRTIAVAGRLDVAGFAHWNRKAGVIHVEPPMALLSRMVTVRVHLDPVDADNAPLLVAPGSHHRGRIPEARMADVVAACGQVACHAAAGDAWLYATPILHASDAALRPRRRRVLHVDYAAEALTGGLTWAGV